MTVWRPDTGQRRLFFDYSQKGDLIARVCQNVVALRLKEEPDFHCLHEDDELFCSLWFSELFLPEVSQLFTKLTQTPFKIYFFFKIFLNSLYPYQSRLSFVSYGLMNENNNCMELSFLNQRHFSIPQHPLETVHHPQFENVCSSFNPCTFNL